ncbi:MAG: hypothetical protein WD468_00265 [Pirellulales bacterium]
MGKAMAIAGMAVGSIIGLAFVLDLVLKFPFGGRVPMMDIGFFLCGAILAYLSWNALRDTK